VAPDSEETWCYELLRRTRWPDGVTCPYCGARHATTHSKPEATPRRRYLCLGCRRTFSDLTGTPLARTNLPLATWVACLDRLQEPSTVAELAERLGVKWETAMRMQRRLAVALDRPGLIRALRDAVAATQGIAQRRPAPETPR
jgi:transposase-like protein